MNARKIMMQRIRMTAAEFFELPETNTPTELLNGELIVSPSPLLNHQRAVRNVYNLVEKLKPNGEVLFAPMDVHFDDDNVTQPDVIWIAENSKCKVVEQRLQGAPDLLVEVQSPGTARTDKTTKFELYQKHGVREYWMVDLHAALVEVWTHDGTKFARYGVYGAGDTFESPVLGNQTVEVNAIFNT
jgi:Uma2 family endonuclease